MFKHFTTIILLTVFAQYIFAEMKYVALDFCTPYVAPFLEPYSDFFPTKSINGVTTLNFYVISERTPHIQLNSEPYPTFEYYEVVMRNGHNELRRRQYGLSYTLLGSSNRTGLLHKFEPLKVRVETKLQSDGKRLFEVYVHDEDIPYLTGVDQMYSLQEPFYQAFGSYIEISKYFFDCEPIPDEVWQALESNVTEQTSINNSQYIA